jgi:hypothetical protein
VLAAALGAAMLALLAFSAGGPRAAHAVGATLALDADISDGACVDIDAVGAAVHVSASSTVDVAVCLDNPGAVAVAAFEYSVIYDDTVVLAMEVADGAPSLDDNPDANAGSTTFTSSAYPAALGGGWDCSGGVGAHPTGDRIPATGPGNGEAYSGDCSSAVGPNTLIEGPLGVIEFAFAPFEPPGKTAVLTLAAARVHDDNAVEIGSCAPVQAVAMTCAGATIHGGPGLALDLDTGDGLCNSIGPATTRTVNAGTAFDVAVCFQNRPYVNEGIIGINVTVTFNDTIIRAPEADDNGLGVDDNPDAMATLPAQWECDNPYPVGDFDGVPFNGTGEARHRCFYENHPNPPFGASFGGPFALIHFVTGAPGTTALSLTGSATAWGSSFNQTYACSSTTYCYGGSITVLCVQPDAECDGADDGIDNCPGLYNADQFNTDSNPRDNGPLAPANDATSMTTDAPGDACDAEDDGDGIGDGDEATFPVPGCAAATAAIDATKFDTDGDHLHDGWECANGSDPSNPASKFNGSGGGDGDADRIPDLWEMRGYNGSGASIDSDGDGCHDLVEVASIDGNTTLTSPDYLSVARRALDLWGPHAAQDYVLDMDKNGTVTDADRLFATRAVLLPTWLPKSC